MTVERKPRLIPFALCAVLLVGGASGPAGSPPVATAQPGLRIAFERDRDGNYDVYTMFNDGSNQERLTDGPWFDGEPSWSPDGSRIAFVTNRSNDEFFDKEIYVMGADGSAPANITNNPADDDAPAWSPNGSRIAFSSDRDGDREIYVMDADGRDAVRLTDDPAADDAPAWAPDGLLIAFASDRNGAFRIYLMNDDGSEQRPLTSEGGEHPSWWSAECRGAGAPASVPGASIRCIDVSTDPIVRE